MPHKPPICSGSIGVRVSIALQRRREEDARAAWYALKRSEFADADIDDEDARDRFIDAVLTETEEGWQREFEIPEDHFITG